MYANQILSVAIFSNRLDHKALSSSQSLGFCNLLRSPEVTHDSELGLLGKNKGMMSTNWEK